MTQPKNRRRAARRRAQAVPRSGTCYIHVLTTGATRNPIGKVSSLDRVIAVGFGSATVCRDGVCVIDGEREKRRSLLTRGGFVTLRKVEKYIRRMRQGHRRWAAEMRAPLWDATWERQRPGKWVCVDAGEGFA
jgi:hypothetical protein